MKAGGGESDQAPDGAWLHEVQQGFFTQRCLHAVARLGIADLLSSGPLSAQELAVRCGADPAALRRVLRFLASQGVFSQTSQHAFDLTPRSQILRSDAPNSARWFLNHDLPARASMEILHSTRTGEAAFDRVAGMSLWPYLAQRPEENDWFNRHMQSQAIGLAMPAVAAFDWSRSETVVDVGGGTGLFLSALLQRHAHLQGVLVDQAHVLAAAPTVLVGAGVFDRCRLVAGNFFERFNAPGDTYVLSRILHDWNDQAARSLLGAVRRAMSPDARLLILETVVPEDDRPHPSKMMDIAMLLLFGGQERTAQEYRKLLESSSFRLTAITPTKGPTSLIEAVPA